MSGSRPGGRISTLRWAAMSASPPAAAGRSCFSTMIRSRRRGGWIPSPTSSKRGRRRNGPAQAALPRRHGAVGRGRLFRCRVDLVHALSRGTGRRASCQSPPPPPGRVHGACLAVLAGDFAARLDGFDPRFVNGQEDIDFCLRLTETGKGASVVPQSTVIHLEGKTQRGGSPYPAEPHAPRPALGRSHQAG